MGTPLDHPPAPDHVRKRFVSDASHELKSPVAAIQALAEAVESALPDDPSSAARFARRLVTESERLGRLVADLLDLSRLEEERVVPLSPVDLSALVAEEVEAARLEADSKLIRVVTEITTGLWVSGDDQQLRLLVRNLLDNALRYSPDGSRIDIILRRESDHLALAVVDQGIGIPAEAQARIFERFYRVDSARSRASGGTGLGLAIAKHAAETHGGSVSVASEVGVGSTFTVRLPFIPGPRPAREDT